MTRKEKALHIIYVVTGTIIVANCCRCIYDELLKIIATPTED